MRMNEPTIRLTDSAFRGHTRKYDAEILYYDSPESDIHRLFTNNDDERSDDGIHIPELEPYLNNQDDSPESDIHRLFTDDNHDDLLFTDPVEQLNDTRDIIQDTLLSDLNELHGLKYSEELKTGALNRETFVTGLGDLVFGDEESKLKLAF